MSIDHAQRRRTRCQRTLVAVGLLSVCLLASLNTAAGQKPTKDYALIFGTVWSPQQRPMPGVKVRIRRIEDKKTRWELISDSRGEFAQRVPPEKADYMVWRD